jgi:hypothetical protein
MRRHCVLRVHQRKGREPPAAKPLTGKSGFPGANRGAQRVPRQIASRLEEEMVRVLTVNSVRLSLQKSNPPTILVEADGTVGTPGWKNLDLVPMENPVSADGILDLEFVGNPPGGFVIQVVRPVTADFVITTDVEKIVGVIVHARTGSATQLLSAPTTPADPSPPALPGAPGTFTTFAIGEEGPRTFPPGEFTKTFIMGEEGPVKTFALGEEGFHTQAVGETPPTPLNVEMIIHKPPVADIQFTVPRERFPGPGPGPGPDPGPDFTQMLNTPFGTR